MYVLFLACAALPIAAIALLALTQVSRGLEEQARERLRRTVKVAGMAIVDRLHLAEVRLRTFEGDLTRNAAFTGSDPDGLERVPFRRVGMFPPASHESGQNSELSPFLATAIEERAARLAAGKSFVAPVKTGRGSSLVLIVPLPEPSPRVVWGELRPEYLFDDEADPAEMEGPGIVALDETGEVVHARAETAPLIEDLLEDLQQRKATRNESDHVWASSGNGGDHDWTNSRKEYIAQSWTLFAKHGFDIVWTLALSEEKSNFLAPIARFRLSFALVAILSILLASYASLFQIRRELVPIDRLHEATRRVADGDFKTEVSLATGDEFEDLAQSFNVMSREVSRNLEQRRRLIDLGIQVTRTYETENLLETVLGSAPALTGAAWVALALFSDDETVTQVQVVDLSGARSSWNREDIHQAHSEDLCGGDPAALQSAWRNLLDLGDTVFLYDLRALALEDDSGNPIGVLALGCPTGERGERCASFTEEQMALGHLLATQTAAALAKTHLLESFKSMFEGLTRLITVAIDEKSPYTYGHCQRVPILTMMVAKAACGANSGALADIDLSPEELYELELAALLHDCGKLTTPVHVVDKATKLQTIFDRIELVEARFEVARRELERAGTPESAALLADLDADLAFLRVCNKGVERLPDDALQRVRGIANKYGWTDAQGWHPALTDDEAMNLSIVRGTLNQEERRIIEHHVVATRKMLQALPYPRHLRRVPEIAGAHHERLDGSGYPDGVRGPSLSIQARILGLADVFEALTAKDRPYKDGRKLSEALAILKQMKDQGSIDPDLFELFVNQGVYVEYARQYLEPDQVDLPLDWMPDQAAA